MAEATLKAIRVEVNAALRAAGIKGVRAAVCRAGKGSCDGTSHVGIGGSLPEDRMDLFHRTVDPIAERYPEKIAWLSGTDAADDGTRPRKRPRRVTFTHCE